MRLIDADELKKSIIKRLGISDEKFLLAAEKTLYEEIENAPTVDAKPVRHGEYIGAKYEWVCSECGCVFEDEEPKYRYCPNCGAEMG